MGQKTVIGNLQVRLTAITDGFTKSMFKASDGLRTFARVANTDVLKAIPKLAGNLTGLLANAFMSIPRLIAGAISSMLRFAKVIGVTVAAAATTAAGALIYLTKQSFAAIDALRVQAVKLDVSTKFLSVLGVAADGAGVSFETATGAITRLTRSISDAAIKGGPARDALKELGLSAYDLIGLGADEHFTKVSEALGKVSNQSDKVRIAVALFGKAGAEVLPLFAENMEEAQKWARILNLEISDFDASQVDAAGDSVALLSKGFKGIGNYLATTFSPLIKAGADALLGYIERAGGIATIAEGAFRKLETVAIGSINAIGKGMGTLRGFAGSVGLTQSTPGNAVRDITQAMRDGLALLGRFKDGFASVFARIEYTALSAAIAVQKLFDFKTNLINAFTLSEDEFNQQAYVQQARLASLELSKLLAGQRALDAESRLASGESEKAYQTQIDGLGRVGASAVSLADQLSLVMVNAWTMVEVSAKSASVAAVDGLMDVQREAALTAAALEPLNRGETATSWFNRIRGEGPSDKIFSFTDKAAKQQETLTDEVTRIWARTADSISDSLASALLNGENLFKSLCEVAKQVAQEILSAFINKVFISAIFGTGTGGGGGGFLGGLFGGATAGATAGIAPSSSLVGSTMSGAETRSVTIVNNFHETVAGDTAIERKVRDGIVKERDLIGNISEERTTRQLARRPRFAMGS